MKVVDPSEITMKIIGENEGRTLKVTGTITGGFLLVSGGTFVTRMKVDNPSGIKKGSKIKVNPKTLEVTKV